MNDKSSNKSKKSEENKINDTKIAKNNKKEKLLSQQYFKKLYIIFEQIYSDKPEEIKLLKTFINDNIYEKLEDKTLDIKERKILYENFFNMIYKIEVLIDNFQINYITKQSFVDIFFNLYLNNINEELDEILIKILNLYIQNYYDKENIKNFFQYISQFFYKKKNINSYYI